jgi:lambda family phage portal protein
MLSGFEEAAMVAARLGACKMAFLVSKLGEVADGYKGDGPAETEGDDTCEPSNVNFEAAPGMMEELPPGMDVTSVDWQYPHAEHGNFVKSILKGAASGSGVSYPSLSSDLEGVNYTSIRYGNLEAQETWKLLQSILISRYAKPAYTAWLTHVHTTGILQTTNRNLKALKKVCIRGRRWVWVDPQKEINAAEKAIALGIKSRSGVAEDADGNFEQALRETKSDEELAEFYGVNIGPDPVEPAPVAPIPEAEE